MESPIEVTEGVDGWNTIIFLYNSALKEVGTKLEILNDEFQHVHQYNPIEYIKRRIKTPESIVKKLKRYGYESTIDNMVNYVNDIAGIRIVCSFTSDIYRMAEMIGKQNDLTVVSVKDYIRHPKESGYKSYHMLVTVPIFLSDRVVDTKVEIQIRTIAMDFWASLEHKIYYKFEGNAPEYISKDLRECAEIVSMLDAKMLSLNEAILEAKAAQEEELLREEKDRGVLIRTADINSSGSFHCGTEFRLAFCLCLTQHIFDDALSCFGVVACCIAPLPTPVCAFANVAFAICTFFCHSVLLFRRMADVFFFLLLEGVEPVCLQLSRHAPRQFEARREAHQRGFRQQ